MVAVALKKTKKAPKIYCSKGGLFCPYTANCKWLKSGNDIPTRGCRNQNENLVATQIAEEIAYL